jgi:hypothetical protein
MDLRRGDGELSSAGGAPPCPHLQNRARHIRPGLAAMPLWCLDETGFERSIPAETERREKRWS